jgi:hypothetical protein
MPPDLLNSREDAILVWAVVILGYAFYKDARGIGSSTWNVARAFFAPKLLLLFGSTALYSAGLVLVGAKIGVWHTTALKETIYWFVGSAVFLVGTAVDATPGWDFVKEVLRKGMGLAIIVAFVVNFYVLPLGYEIVFVFLVLVLTLGRAAAPYAAGTQPRLGKTIDQALTGIGLLLLAAFALIAIFDPNGLFTRDTAERFLVVPILTVALIPYLLAVAWYCRREVASLRRQQLALKV